MNKAFQLFLLFCLISTYSFAQNVSGKWVGKMTQGPGDGISRLYDFEVDLKQNKKNKLYGESYGYIADSVRLRIAIGGSINNDTLTLKETEYMVIDSFVIPPWQLCVKNLLLAYRQEGEYEYLQGSWDGRGLDDAKTCEPGSVILARKIEDIDLFIANGGFTKPVAPVSLPPIPEFSSDFIGTNVSKTNELVVQHRSIEIHLSDYKNIDNDTVSVYLNRKPLAKRIRIARSPVKLNFNLDNRTDLHEILLYAENLGKIPPNTSMMEIIDGDKTYKIKIESDKQKTAAIYLRYKP